MILDRVDQKVDFGIRVFLTGKYDRQKNMHGL